jgi:diguanylate cyclase (GGDEF)-like protein
MRSLLNQILDSSTPNSRGLMAVALSLPFFLVFWGANTEALLLPEIRQGIHADAIWALQALLSIGIAVNAGAAVWLWRHRRLPHRFQMANLTVAMSIGLTFLFVTIGYGAYTTGGNLVMFGVMVVGLLLFDQRTMVTAFVVCLSVHLAIDALVLSDQIPYAPIVAAGTFERGQPTWWWALWRNTIFYAAWAALLPLILVLFSRLDELHAQLSKLSYTDVLTGLANRRYFMDRLTAEAERQSRSQQPFSLVLMDADHFKRINDQFGHAAGDEVLRFLADTLVAGIRTPTDQAARLGGEEFGLILPDTNQAAAAVVCQRIANALRNHQFEIKGQRFSITVSMGVVECHHIKIEHALKQADVNLYQAKHDGRDRVISSRLSGVPA